MNNEDDNHQPLERFELEEVVDHWLYEIEKKAKKTIKAAENTDLEPLNEDDIKAILLSHATWLLGNPVDARRSNDLDDLIRLNGLR
jgi:hypothetical protein